jgi:CheY-like chemotaxis protein
LARKVLLADDSVTAQNMGRRILVDAGYEVITVNNGSSALKKVTESRPDLIVLDVYMPGYGGLEVCQRIRESPETARIPILLTVGKLEPFKAEEARRVRADAFIVKPFDASELLTALTKLEDKIVPQRKSGRPSNGSDDAAYAKEFGDIETGWKNRLKIPPPHQARAHQMAPDSDSGAHLESPSDERVKPDAQQGVPSELPVLAEASASDATSRPASETKDEGAVPQFEPPKEEEPVPAVAAAPEITPEGAPQEQGIAHEDEVAAALASLVPSNGHGTEAAASATEPLPVTIAAAVAGQEFSGPRWIAQEVALTDDESALILEQEMHKAFAAFAAADAARMSLSSSPDESRPHGSHAEVVPAAGESSESHSEEPVSFGGVGDKQELVIAPAVSPDAVTPAEPAQPTADAEETQELAAYAAAAAAGSSAAPPETSVEAVASAQPDANAPGAPAPGEPRHDADLAAAWASWKQVRDSVSGPELTSQIADAAATGFKEIRHEETTTKAEPEMASTPPEENGTIAIMVDRVLAEIKPKLVEEIAKKIKKQK